MQVGTAAIDITPTFKAQLTGFMARVQPSLGVHDPLRVRALYLRESNESILFLHADVLGLTSSFVTEFRQLARKHLGLLDHQLVLSTTHTHAGPATMALINCGEFEGSYTQSLHEKYLQAARLAMSQTEPVSVSVTEGHCSIAADRRGKPSAHVDHRVGVIAFRRADGGFKALLANYAIHNVGLSGENRQISSEITGHASATLERQLPGNPRVLFTVGAAGNINPPALGTDFRVIEQWADQLAASVDAALPGLPSQPEIGRLEKRCELSARLERTAVPFEPADMQSINLAADQAKLGASGEFASRFCDAVETWRSGKLALLRRNALPKEEIIELHAIRIGDCFLLGVNGELFSRLADDLRLYTGKQGYVLGYTNGNIGYVPTAAAYPEGGYEVDLAFIFYDSLRLAPGAFEAVASRGSRLIEQLFAVEGIATGGTLHA